MNIKDCKINCEYDNTQPMHCEKTGCKEQLNGLNHFYLEISNEFTMHMWLCEGCAEKFKEELEK